MLRHPAFVGQAFLAAVALIVSPDAARAQGPAQYFEYRGMCEASAAVAVGPDHFVVAEDQTSILRLYRRGEAEPVHTFPDLAGDLGVPTAFDGKNRKTDIEGAAAVEGTRRIYWITGHSERWRTQRRFFATDLSDEGGAWSIKLVGTPYRELREDLLADKSTIGYIDNPELRESGAANGFNIEGLATAPDGQLLIGLRNPVVKGKALAVRLENPEEVLLKGVPPKFGEIVRLSLDGKGIRSIDRVGDRYLIVAGPVEDAARHALYWWSGVRKDKPVPVLERIGSAPDDFRPEAMFEIPGAGKLQLLGDEGDVEALKAECKKAAQEKKKFRSLTIAIPR